MVFVYDRVVKFSQLEIATDEYMYSILSFYIRGQVDTQASLEEMAKMERRVQWETRVRKATVAFQDSL